MMNAQVTLGHERSLIKTRKMLELEQKHGKPIDELVIEAYTRFGFRGAHSYLGITGKTLSSWIRILGLVSFYGLAKREALKELGLSVVSREELPTE
jgi:hypothetical protein